jgi:hypothetical protein
LLIYLIFSIILFINKSQHLNHYMRILPWRVISKVSVENELRELYVYQEKLLGIWYMAEASRDHNRVGFYETQKEFLDDNSPELLKKFREALINYCDSNVQVDDQEEKSVRAEVSFGESRWNFVSDGPWNALFMAIHALLHNRSMMTALLKKRWQDCFVSDDVDLETSDPFAIIKKEFENAGLTVILETTGINTEKGRSYHSSVKCTGIFWRLTQHGLIRDVCNDTILVSLNRTNAKRAEKDAIQELIHQITQ